MSTSTDDEPMFDERITGYPWPKAIIGGIWTFIGGYLLMVAIVLPTAEFSNSSLQAQLRTTAYIFYNAQFVELSFEPAQVIGVPANYLSEGASLPIVVYYAVPVVAALAGGALVARSTVDGEDYEEYVLPGVGVTVGYLGTALLARFLVQDSIGLAEGGTATWAPDLLQTAIFCLAYPLALGTLGGLLVIGWRRREDLKERVA